MWTITTVTIAKRIWAKLILRSGSTTNLAWLGPGISRVELLGCKTAFSQNPLAM
jgi:hypothetical protein